MLQYCHLSVCFRWGFKVTADEKDKLALLSDEVDSRTRTNVQVRLFVSTSVEMLYVGYKGAWKHMSTNYDPKGLGDKSFRPGSSAQRALQEDVDRYVRGWWSDFSINALLKGFFKTSSRSRKEA
jgi:hypothetical protein